MPNNRAIANRHHRLRAILRLLAKTSALTAAENNDFHVFKEFTLAAYALEKVNDQMAEISMRLKQLKHFLQFFCRVYQSAQDQHYRKNGSKNPAFLAIHEGKHWTESENSGERPL
jgi:hypothetical protein